MTDPRSTIHNPQSTGRRRGLFITFEGPEGAGKPPHSRRLPSWLKMQGQPVLLTREPGGTALGDEIRKILLSHRHERMNPLTELCLYEASRVALVQEVILPALKSGKVVRSEERRVGKECRSRW